MLKLCTYNEDQELSCYAPAPIDMNNPTGTIHPNQVFYIYPTHSFDKYLETGNYNIVTTIN